MKKALITFSVLASIGFSCNPKEVTESENLALSGVYNVGSFQFKESMQKETMALLGNPLFGETPFNFISADSVVLDKTFGEAIFGASAFSYELTEDNTLTLITPEQRIEMSYEEIAGMKLTLDNQYLANITLVKMEDSK